MSGEGVDNEVSRDKLEQELQGIEGAIEDLEDRIKDIEDRDMMAQLESLSLEEEVQEVEELLNHMSKEELEKRLNMVEQIKEEYQEGKVHEKLEYLYRQIKEVKQQEHDSKGANANVEELRERMNQLERQVEGRQTSDNEGTTEIPQKYKKAVRSNYNELKELKKKLENKSGSQDSTKVDVSVDNSKISELEEKINELEGIKDRLQEMENDGEVVFVERDDEELADSGEPRNLSSIEFDLKSIKSRISKIEGTGSASRIDQSNIQSLRKKVKKLEKKVENKESVEIQAFKNNIEQRVKEAERNSVSEEEVDEQVEELRESIENQLRKLDSEINRAVREGEDRLQNLEEVVEQNVLDEFEETESDLSERIDTLMEIILDNQDYLDQLDQELQHLSEKQSRKADVEQLELIKSELETKAEELEHEEIEVGNETVQELQKKIHELEEEVTERDGLELENLKKKVEELETGVPEEESVDKSRLEKKIDNLAEHVMRNQEKLHQLEQKIEMEGSAPHSDDVTIIS